MRAFALIAARPTSASDQLIAGGFLNQQHRAVSKTGHRSGHAAREQASENAWMARPHDDQVGLHLGGYPDDGVPGFALGDPTILRLSGAGRWP
jgi:hypothetical protein